MDWDREAEGFLARVPLFVRPLARRKVEQYARSQQAQRVTEEIARRAYEAFRGGEGETPAAGVIESLEAEAQRLSADPRFRTRHYSVRPCAGAVGCPRALIPVREVAEAVVQRIADSDFASFLEAGRAGRPILSHHRFQAAVAGCPNACSQPQIHDFGVIGAAAVRVQADLCDGCMRCVEACAEGAITVAAHPAIDLDLCIGCADCVRACPTGALTVGEGAYRILAGGKLGRHPRLADEVARVGKQSAVGAWLARCLNVLMTEGKAGERLAVVLERVGLRPAPGAGQDQAAHSGAAGEDAAVESEQTTAAGDDIAHRPDLDLPLDGGAGGQAGDGAAAPDDQPRLWDELTAAMKAEFGDDARRINHALRVFGFARELLAAETGDPTVVAAAALLHDIGIQAAERKHGSAAGRFQEIEGPPIARAIMARLDLDQATVEHVCRIIANHHSARDIDTPEFRIIWDADWLVNLPEEVAARDRRDLAAAIARIFRTRAGANRAREMFLDRR